jgi:hypothetical protein
MATVTRESGAWKDIIGTLKKYDIEIEHISDLPKMLNNQKNACTEAAKIFEKENKELQEQYKKAVENLSTEWDKLTKSIRAKFDEDIERLDKQLEIVRNQMFELQKSSFFSKLFHIGSMVSLWREEYRLKSKRQRLPKVMKKELELREKIHNSKMQKFDKKNSEYQYGIERKVKIEQEKVTVIEEILKSGVYFGAIAEVRMIDLLRKLPDNYYVLNDVKLRLDRSVFFDNDWLSSAQIDHLVIGPAGIFVVEVKNWSEKFSSEGDFFDPYQQVKRHNYVCYILLKRRFDIKVRNIIACAGHIPTKPTDSYVKVLPLEQVNNHILWFKDKKHDPETIQRIVHFIENAI